MIAIGIFHNPSLHIETLETDQIFPDHVLYSRHPHIHYHLGAYTHPPVSSPHILPCQAISESHQLTQAFGSDLLQIRCDQVCIVRVH